MIFLQTGLYGISDASALFLQGWYAILAGIACYPCKDNVQSLYKY